MPTISIQPLSPFSCTNFRAISKRSWQKPPDLTRSGACFTSSHHRCRHNRSTLPGLPNRSDYSRITGYTEVISCFRFADHSGVDRSGLHCGVTRVQSVNRDCVLACYRLAPSPSTESVVNTVPPAAQWPSRNQLSLCWVAWYSGEFWRLNISLSSGSAATTALCQVVVLRLKQSCVAAP